MELWQGEKRWRMVMAFDKEADHLASQPEGMLVLVDSATGEQRPVFIQQWDVIRHVGEPLTLRLEVQVVQERDPLPFVECEVAAALNTESTIDAPRR